MAAFGPYETVEEILSRPWVLVATARRAGEDDPPQLVLKAPRPMPGLETPAQAEQRRRDLLQAAAVQEQVAKQKHSRHWAKVREISSAAPETYVVMDRYDRSAADLSRQRKLTRSELRTLSLAVLEGLEEIGTSCGRGHGRLNAANVLLKSKGGSVLGEIVLSDPAPQAPQAESVDLRDFGYLVRHLATGYKERAGDPPDGAWAHLGSAAGFWRKLTSELIRPDAGDDTLDLPGLVKRITRKAPTERRWKVPAAVGLVVVLCAVAGVFFFTRPPKVQLEDLHDQWQELCIEEDGWSKGLFEPLKARSKTIARELDEQDPLRQHVARRVGEIDSLLKTFEDSIPVDKQGRASGRRALAWDKRNVLMDLGEGQQARPWDWLTLREFKDGVEAAHAALMSLRAALSGEEVEGAERWELHRNLDRLSAEPFQDGAGEGIDTLITDTVKRMSPASYVEEPTDGSLESRYQRDAAGKVVDGLVDAAELEYRLTVLAQEWQEAVAIVAELGQKAGDDPVLKGVGKLLSPEAVGMPADQVWDTSAVELVTARVTEALGPLRRAQLRVAEASWSETDSRLLSIEAEKLVDSGSVTPGTVSAWSELAAQYRRLAGTSPVAALIARLDTERARLDAIVDDSTTPDEEVVALRAEIDDLSATLSVQNNAWILKHETMIREAATGHAPEVAAIVDRVGAMEISAEEMITMLETDLDLSGEVTPLQTYRVARQREWIEGVQRDTLKPYKVNLSLRQLDASLGTISAELLLLDVPSVPAAFDEGRIAGAVRAEWIRALESALGAVSTDWELGDFTLSGEDSERIQQIATARAVWLGDAEEMLSDLASAFDRLSAYEPLDNVGAGGESPQQSLNTWTGQDIYTQLGGDESFGPLVRLAADLEGVRAADRSTLISWVTDRATRPQLAYAAWRRLGAPDALWPVTADEFVRADEYIGVVRAVFAGESGLIERANELRVEAAARWSAAVEGAMAREDWAAMEAAFGMMPSFDVEIGEQAAGVRLNAALYLLKRSVASGEDSDAEPGLVSYRAAVAGLALSAQAAYESAFREFENKAASGTNVKALMGAGPGAHGWVGDLAEGPTGRLGEVLRFRGGAGLELEFRLIQEETNPPRLVYLSTAEVSIGVAAWAFSSGDRSELEGVWSMLGKETWDGLRLWAVRGGNLVVVPNRESWFTWTPLAAEFAEKFAPGVLTHEPVPAERFPMQHVSFAAAEVLAGRLGCRLPSRDEWVLGAARPAVGGVANLRDASFGVQRDYVTQAAAQLPYPDDGIYAPNGTDVGAIAADGRGADRTLFFNGVGGNGGFGHMAGNVAEWVDVGGEPGVMGGSALSESSEMSTPGMLGGVKRLRKRQSFSDVGFRLALEFPGTLKPSLAQQIQDWFGAAETRYVSTAR